VVGFDSAVELGCIAHRSASADAFTLCTPP